MRNTEEKSIITFELKNNKADVKWELKKEHTLPFLIDVLPRTMLFFLKNSCTEDDDWNNIVKAVVHKRVKFFSECLVDIDDKQFKDKD